MPALPHAYNLQDMTGEHVKMALCFGACGRKVGLCNA